MLPGFEPKMLYYKTRRIATSHECNLNNSRMLPCTNGYSLFLFFLWLFARTTYNIKK